MKISLQELIYRGDGTDIKEYTCYQCEKWQKCPFAFDAYNTQGDCLAEK